MMSSIIGLRLVNWRESSDLGEVPREPSAIFDKSNLDQYTIVDVNNTVYLSDNDKIGVHRYKATNYPEGGIKMKKKVLAIASILSLAMTVPAFAGATHSFSVGAEMTKYGKNPAIDTTQEVLDVAYNLVSTGYTPRIVLSREDDKEINISGSTITPDWLNSGVVYLAGHGDETGNLVLWTNSNTTLNYRVANYNVVPAAGRNVNDANLTNCKLAIMAACYSGLSGGIAQSFQKNGADCAIGWTTSVSDVSMARYNKILTSYLANGATVQNAIKGANADIKTENDIYYDPRVFNYKTYGSGVYNTIKRNISRSENAIDFADDMSIFDSVDKNGEGIYNPDTFVNVLDTYDAVDAEIEYRDGEDTEIISYIQENMDARFDKSLFDIAEIETIPGDDSDLLLTYRYKVGDVVSDFGYNVNIENYKMVGIQEVGSALYGYDAPATIALDDVMEEKVHAYNAKNADCADEVIEQDVEVKFSSKDKSFVYFVNTEYKTEDGGIYRVHANI